MINGSKKLITFLLITSFIISPYFAYVKKVDAQVNPSGYQTNNPTGYGSQSLGASGSGLVGYISGIAPAIAQLPLCREKLAGAIQNLFSPNIAASASISVGSSPYSGVVTGALSLQKSIEDAKNVGTIASSSVATYDEVANQKLDEQQKQLDTIKKSTSSLDENDSCLKSIARMVIKMLLQKITLSTVAWIQGGYEGKPFFVEHTGEFLTDLARTEILQFGLEIDDQNLFPFGKDYMIRQANYFNRRFQENARYSLNELIAETSPEYTANDFIGDFSSGGWNGWLGMTMVPANNPIGFELLASEELGARVNGQVNDVNARLQQADGFLGDQRCAEPKGLTREAHNAALENPVRIPIIDPSTGKTVGYEISGTCKKWEYVTPGKLIAETATNAINYPTDNILKAEDMNDAVALLIDSVVAKFSSDFMNRGFAGLSSQGREGSLIINQDEFYNNSLPTQVEVDFPATSIRGWLASNPHFNIRKDLNQAVIDEQRTYVLKAQEQNEVIDDLIKTTFQLDYCIPGPHPGWEIDSRRILTAAENAIVSKTPADMKDATGADVLKMVGAAAPVIGSAVATAVGAGAAAGSVVPGLGTIIGAAIGLFIGALLFIINNDAEKLLSSYYEGHVKLLTGIHLGAGGGNPPSKLANKHEITKAFDTIFERYTQLIHKYFTPGFLPTVAPEAAIKYSQIPGYKQIQEYNRNKIVELNGIVKRLSDLKVKIDTLNATLGTSPTGEQLDTYEAYLKPIINEFSRLSEGMVSGDDIAYVDNSLKQARDEVKYIFTDLLKGPYGCEQDLQFNRQDKLVPDPKVYPAITPAVYPEKAWILKNTLRAEYPFELWYDYNKIGPNGQLPVPADIVPYLDPLNMPATTYMPNNVSLEPVPSGPGFLSRVYFDYSAGGSCKNRLPQLSNWELDCLIVSDLFNEVNNWAVSVGKNKFDPYSNNEQKNSSFEQTIYIY